MAEFKDGQLAEISSIRERRTKLGYPTPPTPDPHDANLFGLGCSGGGIRSATFSLGIIQALAEMRLLGRLDYL